MKTTAIAAALGLALAAATLATAHPGVVVPRVQLAKPHYFAGHFSVAPRIPVAADLDGDGFADLACVYPPDGGIVDVSLSERGLKMHAPRAVAHGLLGEPVVAAARKGEVAWVTKDGVLARLRHGKKPERVADVGAGIEALLPLDEGWLAARHDGDWMLEGSGPVRGPAKWKAVAAWKDTVFWTDGQDLHRGALEKGELEDQVRAGAGKSERLVAGDFDGDGKADVLCGSTFYFGGSFEPVDAPGLPEGGFLLAADVSGDGRTDLVWCRRDADRFRGHDISVLVSYGPDSTDKDGDGLNDPREAKLGSDPLARDTDEDGIPDLWEVDGFAGFDFAAEGFHPAKKDVLCYVQRRSDTDGAQVRQDIERARGYYAKLRIPIQLHLRWLAPLTPKEAGSKPWWDLGNAALPPAMRGLAHYIVVSPGGGGQSAQLGDMGGCGNNALYATFLHEFGHQIGLDHTGFFQEPWCPLYTSLMNYAYNYGFDGSFDKIHYSDGTFSSCVMNESDLREVLPFPLAKVKFLEKGPFHFKLLADGEKTKIDWNRNGKFDDGPVKADVNTSYSTDGGHRSTIGKTKAAPALVEHEGKVALFTVNAERKLERRDLARQTWSAPRVVHDEAATGDPFAVSWKGELLVFVPTARGVVRVGGEPLEGSEGCEVSLAPWGERLVVFLWKAGKARWGEWRGSRVEGLEDFPLASTFPPGAVFHPPSGELWVGVGENQDARRKSRWRLYRLAPVKGSASLEAKVEGSRWLAGEGAGDAGDRRPNLLWEAAEDRLHWISTGLAGSAHSCFYDEMTIGDASYRDGWLLKRYYDEWTQTQSAVGACWHNGDIVLAARWFGGKHESDDNLFVAHRGLGIGKLPMSDFDDVGHITGYGLAHSIPWLAQK